MAAGGCKSVRETPVECGRLGGSVRSPAQQAWAAEFGERQADNWMSLSGEEQQRQIDELTANHKAWYDSLTEAQRDEYYRRSTGYAPTEGQRQAWRDHLTQVRQQAAFKDAARSNGEKGGWWSWH